jgi:hypothetical protein
MDMKLHVITEYEAYEVKDTGIFYLNIQAKIILCMTA